jgi:hypothetical protein
VQQQRQKAPASKPADGVLHVRVLGGCHDLVGRHPLVIRLACAQRGSARTAAAAQSKQTQATGGEWNEELDLVVQSRAGASLLVTCWVEPPRAKPQLLCSVQLELTAMKGWPVREGGEMTERTTAAARRHSSSTVPSGPSFVADALHASGSWDGLVALLPPGQGEEAVRAAFDEIDTDGSGTLDRQEVGYAAARLGERRYGGRCAPF